MSNWGLFLMCLLLTVPMSVQAERKALLLGNADYDARPLRNPTNDVDDMAAKLTALQFQVTTGKNLNRKQMREKIRSFARNLQTNDEALFYFSGHGAQVAGQNYLIPLGNDIQDDNEISGESVPLDFVLTKLRDSQSRLNIVILDACRDNPFHSLFKSSTRGLARLEQRSKGTLVAFAASAGGVSEDGAARNGTYTQYLLKHMATPGITLNQMFTRVRQEVNTATSGKQFPVEENGLLEDVYLVGKVVKKPPPPLAFEPETLSIRGGTFQMGCVSQDKDCQDDEKVHSVTVGDFYMGKTEVTNAQYRQFKPDHNSGEYQGHSLNGDDQPVVKVSWNDAVAYTKWLSEKTGKSYRLPTEAEWEYAARAGTTTVRFWGNNADDACAYANVRDKTVKKVFDWSSIHQCDDAYPVTAPVGRFQPNAWGLYDIMGNVWEWTCTNYKDYDNGVENKCVDANENGSRVLRGGSWLNRPWFVRVSNRFDRSAANRDGGLGFRVVYSVGLAQD